MSISKQDLIDAAQDLVTIETVVNSSSSAVVKSRLGASIDTLRKAIQKVGFKPEIIAWSGPGTLYDDFQQLVTESSVTYRLVQIHTSTSTFQDDLDSGFWAPVNFTIDDLTNSNVDSSIGTLTLPNSLDERTAFNDLFNDFVITEGNPNALLPSTSVDLTTDTEAGAAYVSGRRVNITSATTNTYTANTDTYVDLRQDGTYSYTEVPNNDPAPAVPADHIRLALVVTDADNITGVTDLRETLAGLKATVNVSGATAPTASGSMQTTQEALDNRVAKFDSLANAVAAVEAGDIDVGTKIRWIGYEGGWAATASGIPKGGNVGELIDAGSPGARPVEDGGSVIHCTGGSGGLYLKALFPENTINAYQFGVSASKTEAQNTTAMQSFIDYIPTGGSGWLPNEPITVTSLTNPRRVNLFGHGFRTKFRGPFGDASWQNSDNYDGTVLIFTATSGNAFEWGDASASPFLFGGALYNTMLLGPGTGTSRGLWQENVISGICVNVAVANFSSGLVWDFVEDTHYYGFRFWGCATGLSSNISGNNENGFHGYEFNRCNVNIQASWGKQNSFFRGLLQSTADDIWKFDTSGGGELESWEFRSFWVENDTPLTGDILTMNGPDTENMVFENGRFSGVSGFSLTGGSNNRGHVFKRLRNHGGTLTITIPGSGMARVVTEELLGINVVDNGKDARINETGSYTGTLTGVTTTETGTIQYVREFRTCTIQVPSIVGTSNSTAMTITGLAQNTIPKTTTEWMPCRVQDNGTNQFGIVRVTNTGELDFRVGPAASTFTGSGSKGTQGFSITYTME